MNAGTDEADADVGRHTAGAPRRVGAHDRFADGMEGVGQVQLRAHHALEHIGPDACVDAQGLPAPFALSDNLKYFKAVVNKMGLAGRASLIYDGGAEVFCFTFG